MPQPRTYEVSVRVTLENAAMLPEDEDVNVYDAKRLAAFVLHREVEGQADGYESLVDVREVLE